MNKKNIKGQVHNAMYQNIRKKGWVAPVDVLIDIGVLTKESYEDWRHGRVNFLERKCHANLSQLSAIMHEVRVYAINNNLKTSWTYYRGWGKNNKNKLRFSKTNNEKVEYHYATHFIDKKRIDELKQIAVNKEK